MSDGDLEEVGRLRMSLTQHSVLIGCTDPASTSAAAATATGQQTRWTRRPRRAEVDHESTSHKRAYTDLIRQREQEARVSILSQILEPSAADRLGRIRLVKASRAEDVENRLITLARSGQLRQKVTEDQLKDMLGAMSEQQEKKEMVTVQRRKGGWDDDDLDDLLNDDSS